jgi:hypothetical protein
MFSTLSEDEMKEIKDDLELMIFHKWVVNQENQTEAESTTETTSKKKGLAEVEHRRGFRGGCGGCGCGWGFGGCGMPIMGCGIPWMGGCGAWGGYGGFGGYGGLGGYMGYAAPQYDYSAYYQQEQAAQMQAQMQAQAAQAQA